MRAGPAEQCCIQCLYPDHAAILDGERPGLPENNRCPAPPTPCYATPFSANSRWCAAMTAALANSVRISSAPIEAAKKVVLAWQFAGESSGRLPQWRCLRLANVSNAGTRGGRWHEGGSHRTVQTCVTEID